MKLSTIVIATLALWSTIGAGVASSRTAIVDSVSAHYVLEDGSVFEYGCFGPCACPVATFPLKGAFELKHSDFDGLFDNYEVSNIKWVIQRPGGELRISGSGKYRVGGEFAVLQQLSLELMVGGEPAQAFDSGVVPGGGGFPRIDIEVSVHGTLACFDTVIRVRAVPAVANAGAWPGAAGLGRIGPNPFAARVDAEFVLPGAGPVEVRVYDAAGRVVRVLARSPWLEAGRHSVDWNGRGEDGLECAAGLYWLGLESGVRSDRRAVVKLK